MLATVFYCIKLAVSLETALDFELYLAITQGTYRSYFQRQLAQMIINRNQVKLLIVNAESEVIVHLHSGFVKSFPHLSHSAYNQVPGAIAFTNLHKQSDRLTSKTVATRSGNCTNFLIN